ncbi:hypothetical protein PO124_03910 [Bacillus licheniformis]|nr:hypothetical protein [Bacillus licheniformis]
MDELCEHFLKCDSFSICSFLNVSGKSDLAAGSIAVKHADTITLEAASKKPNSCLTAPKSDH